MNVPGAPTGTLDQGLEITSRTCALLLLLVVKTAALKLPVCFCALELETDAPAPLTSVSTIQLAGDVSNDSTVTTANGAFGCSLTGIPGRVPANTAVGLNNTATNTMLFIKVNFLCISTIHNITCRAFPFTEKTCTTAKTIIKQD